MTENEVLEASMLDLGFLDSQRSIYQDLEGDLRM